MTIFSALGMVPGSKEQKRGELLLASPHHPLKPDATYKIGMEGGNVVRAVWVSESQLYLCWSFLFYFVAVFESLLLRAANFSLVVVLVQATRASRCGGFFLHFVQTMGCRQPGFQ